jgi:hypothetical protein
MGLEQSRAVTYPSNIDDLYESYKERCTPEMIRSNHLNVPKKGKCTMGQRVVQKAVDRIWEYLKEKNITYIKILEPFAGQGIASNIIQKRLNVEIRSTDILDLSKYMDESSYPVEFGLSGVDTVEKYYIDGYNTLMMISPPPESAEDNPLYGDYFTIRAWTNVESAKLFIFIGEMGASDGSEGLYDYMINHPIWKLDYRKMLYRCEDVVGGPCEKELFIFVKREPSM